MNCKVQIGNASLTLIPIKLMNILQTIIKNCIEKYSPKKTIKIPAKRIILDPWMTSGLIRSSKVMDQLYKQSWVKINHIAVISVTNWGVCVSGANITQQ